jgi:hypothetical protein
MRTDVIVFCGPTIPAADARTILPACYVGPAAQGDIYRATRLKPRVILLIDGVFERVPAVSHKELLYALSLGIRLVGCSSMGALRAVELASFGMQGVGRIFEHYANGDLEDDDEVALIHAPKRLHYRPLSEPMVNVRATLLLAVQNEVVPSSLGSSLIATAKALHFPDRNWERILGAGVEEAHSNIVKLRKWIAENRVDQKRKDAEAALDLVRRGKLSKPVAFCFEETVYWQRIRDEADCRSSPSRQTAERHRGRASVGCLPT